MSFIDGIFPTAEKTAKVTPSYKSGERSHFDNYRPISVLNVLSKVLERLAYKQITDYLEKNNLLSSRQYGFRRERSTQHAVMKFVDYIRENMDQGKVTGALYMDFREAFDTVSHSCILHKLPYYGITSNELAWIGDYLFNRSQLVNFNGTCSKLEYITHDVPQGSILGPLLFIILVNDLNLKLGKCELLMYADDTVLYFADKKASNIKSVLNSESDIIHQWITENCLILNLKKGKTEFVLYGSKAFKTTKLQHCY